MCRCWAVRRRFSHVRMGVRTEHRQRREGRHDFGMYAGATQGRPHGRGAYHGCRGETAVDVPHMPWEAARMSWRRTVREYGGRTEEWRVESGCIYRQPSSGRGESA